jgi:hypothetical protein
MSQIATFECEVITREYKLVGQSITANFPNSFPDAAIKILVSWNNIYARSIIILAVSGLWNLSFN